jgi:DNA-binding winged helix-turn-helix (wHTH) protein/class 3 adenylate cyclase/tetratricopeptide (TPR) repeat protein
MRYVFGDYSLDTQGYELRRVGELIPLGPQVFNVLAYLVAHRDCVVSRDELFARLWPDQFVTEDALERCIRAARRALEDRPEAPRYITTTRGRGYRFIAPVQEQPDGPPEDEASTTVPAQSISRPPSTAGSEGPPPPVFLPTVSGDRHRLSEELRPPSLAGEYKQVTVLCGGLADALALAMRLGPEAMHRCMQTVFTVVQQVLQRYAGSLIELSGEGFVALFGAPVAQEDHAQRAVLAALALHERLGASAPDLRPWPGASLALCLGLHTGRVVVDRLGGDPPRLYTAAGETTQVAMRLRQLASPGTTLLSAATQHLVQDKVRVELWGEVQISATHAPMPVYGVRGIVRQRSGVVGYGARARSLFVGRARELALLHERLDAVVAGQGQVVAVVGEPGMGKSRLLAEYCHSLVGREVRYVEGHCLSYGRATPYLPLVDLVRQLCAITPGEPHDAVTAKIHCRLQQADLALDEGAPLLLSLLDIPTAPEPLAQLSPEERKARTFALLRHLVLHEAQRHPCILALENLHWSDATSEAWLTSLVERLAGAALLVLVTYRPGYQPPWLAQSYATQMALSPLRANDSRVVVQAVLQTTSVPETMVQEIVTQAAGNPFFLEELAWNVVEHEGQPAPLAVPETIEAVLAARIDRLPPEAKRLLQAAAVIGMEVAVPLLQAVTDLTPADLHACLGHLQTAEFLYETGRLPASAYTFKHALTQKVAYESLLQERRRVLHRRIVEALEALYADCLAEQTARLAHHAWHGEMWEKALAYLRQAGVKAIASSANREAVAHFERALVALQHLSESRTTLEQAIDVRCELRTALLPLNERRRMFDILREAEALAQELNDQRRLGRVSVLLTHYLWTGGDLEHALATGHQVLDLATTSQDVNLQVMAYFALGEVYYSLGNYRRAMDMLRWNVQTLDHIGPQERFGEPALGPGLQSVASRRWLIQTLADVGAFAEAIAIAEDTLRLAEADGHPYTLVLAYMGVGYLYLGKGAVHQALPLLDRGLELCRVWGLQQLRVGVDGALGYALALSGRIPEALALLERTVGQTPFGSPTSRIVLHAAWVSEVYLRAGHVAEAHTLAVQALALAREHKERGTEAWTLRLLGDIAMHCDPPEAEQAEDYYRQALVLAEELGMRPLQAHCHLGLGTLYSQTGQVERARTALAAAIDLYRPMEMTFWLPQAEAALAQVEG